MVATKLLTVEEFERMSTEGFYELIEGELVEMTPAGGRASTVGATFVYYLNRHVLPRRLGRVYNADCGFVLFPDRALVRAPDAAFVQAERLPPEAEQEGFLRLAPDLAVEVLSPSDRLGDALAKVAQYLEAGVRLVWLVDPRARTVAIFTPTQPPHVLRDGDVLDGGAVLPQFSVPVTELFV